MLTNNSFDHSCMGLVLGEKSGCSQGAHQPRKDATDLQNESVLRSCSAKIPTCPEHRSFQIDVASMNPTRFDWMPQV